MLRSDSEGKNTTVSGGHALIVRLARLGSLPGGMARIDALKYCTSRVSGGEQKRPGDHGAGDDRPRAGPHLRAVDSDLCSAVADGIFRHQSRIRHRGGDHSLSWGRCDGRIRVVRAGCFAGRGARRSARVSPAYRRLPARHGDVISPAVNRAECAGDRVCTDRLGGCCQCLPSRRPLAHLKRYHRTRDRVRVSRHRRQPWDRSWPITRGRVTAVC